MTDIGGFIKLLAGDQSQLQACSSPQVAGGKDVNLKGRFFSTLKKWLLPLA